ncbi:aminotransferase class V-fold PLP-dependent enzyme [Streptomyces qinzhouensis]|uniref:Aminotransferase class V-fold PLP-dependent enzyme n=1 Tax=Streptomyces qinzhouensis TaxID=2599401 RepID=A0A5B8J8E9_9ACTN|nr:aminotransferase class V-fold PLP-dependent enzyme [Streptomyces qinzhouensis]QDY76171.1 aminotransferase class V-fold PLP-dependent enzyme [Streptomyces qinzhouensis]
METPGGAAEFALGSTYLNTASCGVLPRRAVAALDALVAELAAGRPGGAGDYSTVIAVRDSFAGLMGVDAARVAVGSSLATAVGLVAQSLPPGAEVLFPEGEYTSVVTPFTARGDLRPRAVPLEGLADAVRPGTALVAFSAVQSADGRIADLAAVREAAAAHGARTLADTSQSAGWLPLRASDFDYTVTVAYKFLLCLRGVSFLTVTEEAQRTLRPLFPGTFASADGELYGPARQLAPTARRFDESPAYPSFHAAVPSLELLTETGVEAVHRHTTGLARRFREGLAERGYAPVPGESAIVSVPGAADRVPDLAARGIVTAARADGLRVSFHLYNTPGHVDRILAALE